MSSVQEYFIAGVIFANLCLTSGEIIDSDKAIDAITELLEAGKITTKTSIQEGTELLRDKLKDMVKDK